MLQKIKLKYKWKTGRSKVIKRYKKIMQNFPQPVVYKDGEDFELYSEKVHKHLLFILRGNRLNEIALKRLFKERESLEKISVILHLIMFIWFASMLCMFLWSF